MSQRPDAQQLIDKSLANFCNPGEINLNSLEVGGEPVKQATGLATRHKKRRNFEELHHRTCSDKFMILGELKENFRQHPFGMGI